jgi:D-citramalate synthase
MDTTRDGEQTSGVSFSAVEKLIAQLLLEELNVDQSILLCTCKRRRFQGVRDNGWREHQRIRNRIEVLTFVDGGLSIEWMKSGAKVQNLLTKDQ